jgi:hypothetical protein
LFSYKTTRTVLANLASKRVVMVSGGLASKPAVTVSTSLTSKPVMMVSGGLASKPVATVSTGLTSTPAVTVFRFGPQNRRLRFDDLDFKITATVSWFEPKTKRDSVCRLRHKTGGEKSVWDTHRDLAGCFT